MGTTIANRYFIEERVATGGMGRVFRARHLRVSRQFAIKVLYSSNVVNDPKMLTRFRQEAEAASRLSHPNVVAVIDYGEENGQPYLVMDYVQGRTLLRLLRQEGPLDQQRVIALTRQLADGMRHAHAHGLIHRDLKPENIIVVREGGVERPRIVDFGLALLPETDEVRLTSDGLVLGTPAFMSPEQASGSAVDHRTDLFSLGLIMFEMLAGKHPFEGSPSAIARQNLAAETPSIRERNHSVVVWPHLEAIMRRLLEKEPAHRFQSAAELIDALDRCAAGEMCTEPAISQRGLHRQSGRRRGRRRAWLAVAAVAMAAVGALVCIQGWNRIGGATEPQAVLVAASSLSKIPELFSTESHAGNHVMVELPGTDIAAVDVSEPVVARVEIPVLVEAKTQPSKRRRKQDRSRGPVRRSKQTERRDISVADFRDRYRAVGMQLERFDQKFGSTAAKNYRDSYLAIPYFDAIRHHGIRREAYAELRRIDRKARRSLRK